MSYIDTFDHEFVGYFGHRWVYHPLESVPPSPGYPRDFACGPEHLVIGGGSGESPGLVILDPVATVDCFIRNWLHWNQEHQPDHYRLMQTAADAWLEQDRVRTPRPHWQTVFNFAGWTEAEHLEFQTWVQSPCFSCPYQPAEFESLEIWLAESIGEFILLAMPELAVEAVARFGSLRELLSPFTLMNNLLIPPPGYPTPGRREIEGQVHWSLSAWNTVRAVHPITVRR